MHVPISILRLCAVGLVGLAAALSLNAAAEEAAVQVYECHQDGKVTFSDEPCAGREQTLEVDYSRPDAAQARAAAQSAAAREYQAGTVAQGYVLDSEILSLEQQITNQETERDARIAALRNQLAQGSEGTDTAAWEASMNQQIASTYEGYTDSILAQRARLGALKAQREALGRQPSRSQPAP
ncbi:DUF4124 domain-containing protein [uncultured Thiodictyon sp.]|jgi:hypothetical protein|uniref:DUF4124 domain-containing protein n=1 Tax=uncultured Thiodictyon sp. TaxID=1846217 RepID=UPI0025CE8ECA|nr:DUF4124 domain-containing protein [uncultured Thiodictyon sp.]